MESEFTRLLRQNNVISKTMKGFVGWQYYSDQVIEAAKQQTLVFYQKTAGEITNMQQSGNFSEGNDHLIVSFQPEIYNPDGTKFNWWEDDQLGLRAFVNTAVVKLFIEDKPYFETPLSDMLKLPEVAKSVDGVSIALPQANAQWKLGTPETLPAKNNFRVEVTGTSGALGPNFGFAATTKLRLKMNTIRRRNVQS